MEKIIQQELPNVRTLTQDPQYFGSFLNMARYHIFTISNHLSQKMSQKQKTYNPLSSEESIPDSFLAKDNGKDFNWRLLYAMTQRYMPVVKIFDDETAINEFSKNAQGVNFEKMRKFLKLAFREINAFRNDYSHYYHSSQGTERKTKVSEDLAQFIREAYQKAIELTKLRFKANAVDQNDILEEKDFEICENIELIESDNTITDRGLTFFIAMFLEREYATLFISKIRGLKGTQYKSFIATREVFMAYCVKLPSNKFVSQDKKQALSLDMINEINKCPRTLYRHITKEAQKAFLPVLSQESKYNVMENSLNSEQMEDSDIVIEDLSKRVRHNNRFYYHALRFMDTVGTLNNWFFHIELGKVLRKTYQKPLGNAQWDRNIEDPIRTFGKLDNFLPTEKKDTDILAKENLDKINASDLNFTQFAPHYHIKNNKIGLAKHNKGKISKYKNGNIAQPLPDAFLSVHELPKLILLEYLEKGKVESIIDRYVTNTTNRFKNLDFVQEIKGKLSFSDIFEKRTDAKNQNAYDIENLNKLHSRKQKLNKVLEPYGTDVKQIPERVIEYWLNIKDVNTERRVSDYIKQQKNDCKQKIKALEKGKAPKVGEMATAMAKDIVNMIVDKEKKQKITSFYYDKIQECLALYADSEKRQLLKTILFRELDLSAKGGHPFISKINFGEDKSTYDLYKAYFAEKGYKTTLKKVKTRFGYKTKEIDVSWLYTNFYHKEINEKGKPITVIKIPVGNDKIPYVYQKLQNTKSTLSNWIHNNAEGCKPTDKKKPIDLPTNLFDNAIVTLLKKELQQHQITFNTDDKLNHLFKLWWQKVRKDEVQNYYNSERKYTIYDTELQFKPNSKPRFSDYYYDKVDVVYDEKKKENRRLQKQQVEKVFKRILAETEKEIRLLQEQDRTVLLMIEQLLDENAQSNLKLSKHEALLNEQITVSQLFTFNKLDDKGKTTEETISKYITVKRKRKDISVLRKYAYDTRRLPGLFEYFSTEESIAMETLKTELDAYNKTKDTVFDKAFELEKAIIKHLENPNTALGIYRDRNIQHQPYLKWLQSKEYINEQEYEFLNTIRNSFSHNQFPNKEKMEVFIKDWKNNVNFAQTIVEVYKEKIDKILTLLK